MKYLHMTICRVKYFHDELQNCWLFRVLDRPLNLFLVACCLLCCSSFSRERNRPMVAVTSTRTTSPVTPSPMLNIKPLLSGIKKKQLKSQNIIFFSNLNITPTIFPLECHYK